MNNKKAIMEAFDNLDKKYSRKYIKEILNLAIFAALKVAAILATAFFLANKIGTPVELGGPSYLCKFLGGIFSVVSVYMTMITLPDIRRDLQKKYNRERLVLEMRNSIS